MLLAAIDFKELHGRALAAEETKMNIITEAKETRFPNTSSLRGRVMIQCVFLSPQKFLLVLEKLWQIN